MNKTYSSFSTIFLAHYHLLVRCMLTVSGCIYEFHIHNRFIQIECYFTVIDMFLKLLPVMYMYIRCQMLLNMLHN